MAPRPAPERLPTLPPAARRQVRVRAGRVRREALTIVQTAAAAAAAWAVARLVHDTPFFAPISAVVALTAARGQRTRRSLELVIGVAVGIAVADAIVILLGPTEVVLPLVVALSMGAALLLGAGQLLASQAATSAVLVATLERPDTLSPDRFVDALIGGAVALLVGQVLFPRNPVKEVDVAAGRLGERLAGALREVAAALRAGDEARARRALELARAAEDEVRALREAVAVARETVSMRPPAWRARGRLPLYAGAVRQMDYAVRNTRVLARRAVAAARRTGPAPEALVEALELLADAVARAGAHLDDPAGDRVARNLALEAAVRATAVLAEHRGLQTSVLVGQVRSTALDLLRGTGMGEDEATEALEHALADVEAAAGGLGRRS